MRLKNMPIDPRIAKIYHITDIANLDGIIRSGGLSSDAAMQNAAQAPAQIGYSNIKFRRLNEYRIACCNNRYVGEFVPFYFCPRSPMLFTVNKGNTGKQPGCQKDIVHLVSSVQLGYNLGRQWAISDGNAGTSYTTFSNSPTALDEVPWEIVNSPIWGGDRITKKAAEFLVADFFPVQSFVEIGCYDQQAVNATTAILAAHGLQIPVNIYRNWYY